MQRKEKWRRERGGGMRKGKDCGPSKTKKKRTKKKRRAHALHGARCTGSLANACHVSPQLACLNSHKTTIAAPCYLFTLYTSLEYRHTQTRTDACMKHETLANTQPHRLISLRPLLTSFPTSPSLLTSLASASLLHLDLGTCGTAWDPKAEKKAHLTC